MFLVEESSNMYDEFLSKEEIQKEIELIEKSMKEIQSETHPDFLFGCDLLHEKKKQEILNGKQRAKRLEEDAIELFEYECQQAKEKYQANCDQLQYKMSQEIQKEILRLTHVRDGVSSFSDRRRTSRNRSRVSSETEVSLSELEGSTDFSGLGTVRLPTDGSTSINTAITTAIVTAVSASGATDQQRKKKEKRRIDSLLAQTSVFSRLTRTAEQEQVDTDLRQIAANVLRTHQRLPSASRLPQSHQPVVLPSKSRRLEYNPSMLQEGDKVVVISSTKQYAGVITSVVKDQIYLLTTGGHFETVSFQDWVQGHIHLQNSIDI